MNAQPPSPTTPSTRPVDPLFPGRTFVSTVLDALDSKKTMTGELTSKYLQRAI